MRKARAALALLLAFAVPVRAETTADPLWYLLSTYVLAPDAKAVDAQGDGPADSKGLAALQADLLVLTDGFEGFRDEAQVKETLERLKPRMSPELRPFFKDRASSLDAIYRTLAVTDYTWAQRFPEPPCEPLEARRKLLASRDGLFQTEKGEASPWLSALLGPQAEGKSAEQALDQASSQAKLTGAEYEKLRARVRKLTMALASDKAVGAARSKLYCSRAAAFADLAAAQRVKDAALISAGRVVAQKPEESVFVVVWKNQRAAATLLRTKNGAVLVTDAAIVADTDHPNLFAYSANAKPVQLTATVARRHPELSVAVLTVAEDPARPALSLAETTPAKDELVTAIGHTQVSGLWTKTSGLVTKVGEVSFQTDAAISPELSGGPVLNEAGQVAGLLVLRPADTEEGRWPVAIPAPVLLRWLDDPTPTFSTPEAEVIEDDGTAAVLTRARPIDLTEAGLGAWNIPGLPPPPSVPHGVCVQNCGGGSSSGSYSSGYSGTGGEELGKALGELGAVLILKGIPALFRGIGKLFKGSGKSEESKPSRSVTGPPTSPQSEAPPTPKLPLKPIGISLWSDKSEASHGDAIRLIAEVKFMGELGSKAAIPVTFSGDGALVEFPTGPTALTDDQGRAWVDMLIKVDEAESAHDDLKREERRHDGEVIERPAPPGILRSAKPESKVKAAAFRSLDALESEDEASQVQNDELNSNVPDPGIGATVEAGVSLPSLATPIIPADRGLLKLNADLSAPKFTAPAEISLIKCPPGTEALMPPAELGQPGHPANASPHKAALEESCRPFEQAANEVCGNDRPCKDEVLLNLGYDFRSCLKRWDQDGSGSPGSLGTPSLNIPRSRNRARCVPIQKARAKPVLRGVWLSNNPENDSSEGQDDAPASSGEADLIAVIVNKLNYLFGKATGDAKNIQRSKEMLRSLERIGLNDTHKNREHVESQLKGVMKNPSAVAKIQLNGRIVKESVLAGPRGVIKMISIWDKGRLITVLFTRS